MGNKCTDPILLILPEVFISGKQLRVRVIRLQADEAGNRFNIGFATLASVGALTYSVASCKFGTLWFILLLCFSDNFDKLANWSWQRTKMSFTNVLYATVLSRDGSHR